MVTGDVMPRNAVVVHVVQHTQAGFSGTVDVKLSVVGLTLLFVASLGPGVVAPAVRDLQ